MKKSFLILTILVIAFGTVFVAPQLSYADTDDRAAGAENLRLENPFGDQSLQGVFQNVLSWLQKLAIALLTIMILYGAWQMIVSAGKPEDFKKGQKTILYAVIGFIIIFIANGIADIVHSILGGS